MRLRAANSFPCDYKFIKDVNFDHFFSNTSVEFNTFTLWTPDDFPHTMDDPSSKVAVKNPNINVPDQTVISDEPLRTNTENKWDALDPFLVLDDPPYVDSDDEDSVEIIFKEGDIEIYSLLPPKF